MKNNCLVPILLVVASIAFQHFTFGLSNIYDNQQFGGIRAQITSDGLNHSLPLIYLAASTVLAAPIDFPNKTIDEKVIVVNLTNMVLHSVSFSQEDFVIAIRDDQGIRLHIGELTAKLDYTATYKFPLLDPTRFKATAGISQTTIDALIDINSQDGKPHVVVTFDQVDIQNITTGASGILGDLEYYFQSILEDAVDYLVKNYVPPAVNSQINEMFTNLTMQVFIDPLETIVLDYSLISDPSFSPAGISIEIAGKTNVLSRLSVHPGNIHPVGSPPCSYVPEAPMQYNHSEFSVFVSETLLQCALDSFANSVQLVEFVNELLESKLNLDSNILFFFTLLMLSFPLLSERISIGFNFTTNDIESSISPDGISTNVGLNVWMDRGGKYPERYITMQVNLTNGLNVSLVIANHKIFVVPDVMQLLTSLFVGPNDYAADMPEKYKRSIEATDWEGLSKEADGFLNSTVLPAVNGMLKSGFQILPQYSQILTQVLKSITLQCMDGFLFFGFDIRLQ